MFTVIIVKGKCNKGPMWGDEFGIIEIITEPIGIGLYELLMIDIKETIRIIDEIWIMLYLTQANKYWV